MAVHRAEVTVFIGPFIPDSHTVVLEIPDVGVAGNEPQKLVDYGLEVNFFGGQERETLAEVKPHLVTENALGTDTGTVSLDDSVGADMAQQVEILLHKNLFAGKVSVYLLYLCPDSEKNGSHYFDCMEKSLIAAVASNGAIGKDNSLLWHISEDLKFFKRTTLGCPVIMGFRTFVSLGSRPLPKRTNIVISTREWADRPDNVVVATSLDEAFRIAEGIPCEAGKCFVIGGGKIYAQAIGAVDSMYITHVDASIGDADTFFPTINPPEWDIEPLGGPYTDPETGYSFEFRLYRRKR